MKLSEDAARLGQERSRINAELRRQGALPPLVTARLLRAVIRDKCLECMGYRQGNAEPRPMDEIRECSSGPASRAPCALWPYRPWQ